MARDSCHRPCGPVFVGSEEVSEGTQACPTFQCVAGTWLSFTEFMLENCTALTLQKATQKISSLASFVLSQSWTCHKKRRELGQAQRPGFH